MTNNAMPPFAEVISDQYDWSGLTIQINEYNEPPNLRASCDEDGCYFGLEKLDKFIADLVDLRIAFAARLEEYNKAHGSD